ncbi:OmpA family protein [Flavobacteriaceae bacterium SZ-1-7]|uniref:OmpA family protein n=1 Tax=Tamlana sedimenti TaxID=3134126 RepID=UPI0031236792
MKLKNHILACLLSIIAFIGHAQDGTLKKADNLFNKYAFVDAAEAYKELIAKGNYADYATRRLADCYAYMRKPESAVVYYEKVVQQENVPIEYYYNYAQALRGVKNYKESRVWLEKFYNAGGKIEETKFSKDGEFLNSIFNARHQYFLKDIKFNSKFSDFGAYEKDGKLYFVSSRDEGVAIKRLYGWDKEPFLDVYVSDEKALDTVNADYSFKLEGQVNSVYHDGPITISNDGKTMYFSRTNFIKNTLSRDDSGVSNLKIYKASLIDNEWTNIEELPFNSNTYSNGHPALNEDSGKLYFASNMPGGIGGTDLYYVEINEDGSYGKPQNLGMPINTRKNERFPFINNEGTLFFSSDGHQGLGLLDVFAAVRDESNNMINVVNLGVPINSSKDDFSFFMNDDGLNGYFASNRAGGLGSDDIYGFSRISRIKLEGTIYDAIKNIPVPNAIVTLIDVDGNEVASFEADENGRYEMNIDRDTDYSVQVKKDGFLNTNTPVTSKGIDATVSSISVDFSLEPIAPIEEEVVITDLGPIYFNFDSAAIRNQETSELVRIVDLMQNTYPSMTIEIQSHSDSRGPASYNLILSEKRAKSTYNYLISKGINPDRIVAQKGFGEQNLVNGCDGTIRCSEADHALNRRTNFIVVKVK